jgi:hypothetical protein
MRLGDSLDALEADADLTEALGCGTFLVSSSFLCTVHVRLLAPGIH